MKRKINGFYEFGSYRLFPSEGLLLREDEPVHLPPKAFDTLRILLRNHGHTVSKEDLISAVWPETIVEEGNLAHNISLLRKALGSHPEFGAYIETIPKRGYRFVAAVRVTAGERDQPHSQTDTSAGLRAATEGNARQVSPPQWLGFVSAVAVTLLIAAAAFYWFGASRPAMPMAERDWVLILDFNNLTGDSRFDHALLTAFTVSMEQSRHVNVYTRARLAEALKRMGRSDATRIDEILGAEVARREGLRALVACSIARVGNRYILTARLLDPREQKSALSLIEQAQEEDRILEAVDKLAGGMRRALGESLYSITRADRPLPRVTTPSLDALIAYSEGCRLWIEGKYREAAELYQQALQYDPKFAMAHAALGSAYFSHIFVEPGRGRDHYESALRNLNRLTDRERSLLDAGYAAALGHREEAIRLYRSYLQLYPDDLDAKYDLANQLRTAERWDDAIAGYEEILRIDQHYARAHINLATSYKAQSRYQDALTHYARGFELKPAWLLEHNLNHEYGFTLVGAGEEDKAREVFGGALASPRLEIRAWRSLALLDMYHGKYEAAELKLREGSSRESDPLSKARNHIFLAILREGRNDLAGEVQELDQAWNYLTQTRPVLWMIFRVAIFYARGGEVQKAAAILERYRFKVDPEDDEQASALHHLEGALRLAQGDGDLALELLQLASGKAPAGPLRVLVLESLGSVYRTTGKLPAAVTTYEALVSTECLGGEAQQAWLAAHYHLARAHYAQGHHEKARKRLDQLLSIWKEADPDLPLLKAARELSERLQQRGITIS